MMKRAQDADRDAPRALVFFTHWQLLLNREEIFFFITLLSPIHSSYSPCFKYYLNTMNL